MNRPTALSIEVLNKALAARNLRVDVEALAAALPGGEAPEPMVPPDDRQNLATLLRDIARIDPARAHVLQAPLSLRVGSRRP